MWGVSCEDAQVPKTKRPNRYSVYPPVVDELDLAQSMLKVNRNDLLPPRPDDGAGGQVAERFVESLKRSLAVGEYEPERVVSVPVSKRKYSTRPAALMNLADRVVYHALVEPLRQRVERGLVSERVLFWPRANPAAKRWKAFEAAPLAVEGAYIVTADVSGFYESIDHRLLQQILLTLTGKVELVETLFDFLGQVMSAPRGLPQGLDTSTSDALATAYLSNVDSDVLRVVHHYWRHGDDIRMTVDNHDHGRRAIHHLEQQLRDAHLLLNAEKSHVLHRETYEKQMKVVDEKRSEVRRRLLRQRESEVLGSTFEELEELMERLGVDFEPVWIGIYEQEIDVDAVVEQLRPHLEPAEVEIAAAAFQEALSRAPGTGGSGELTDEEFHGIFQSSMTVLITAVNPIPIAATPKVIGLFPEKTRTMCEYLRKVAQPYPQQVSDATIEALTTGYLTGLQESWLLTVLRDVVASGAGVALDPIAEVASRIAENEAEMWLARVEAARLLAQISSLGHDLLSRIWNRAPAALRADLVAAVATVARNPEVAWAVAFRDSLNPDPLMQVVLQNVDNSSSKASTDTTATESPEGPEDPTG